MLFATRARPGWAGAMAALAAFWRPDVGAIAALAAAATLLLRARGARERRGGRERATAACRGAAGRGGASGARRRGERAATRRARRGRGAASAAARARARPGAAGAAARGAARRRARGRGGAGRGERRRRGRPVGAARARGVCLLVAAAGLLVLYAPFLVAAGPGTVWDALVVQATRDGEWWRLPFPAGSPAGTRRTS